MTGILLQQAAERSAFTIWGVIIPALIFIIAFLMTLALYRHFASNKHLTTDKDKKDSQESAS